MARASDGTDVTTDMAQDALEYRSEVAHPSIERYAQFYNTLTATAYFLGALADEDDPEGDEDLMSFVRGENPSAWDNAREDLEAVRQVLLEYVAEEHPDEVVETLG